MYMSHSTVFSCDQLSMRNSTGIGTQLAPLRSRKCSLNVDVPQRHILWSDVDVPTLKASTDLQAATSLYCRVPYRESCRHFHTALSMSLSSQRVVVQRLGADEKLT
jgi:hypothetical protein